jgi:hypothetical protein
LVQKPEEKRPLRRPRHRWQDNIEMDLRFGGSRLDSSGSEQVLVVDCCEHSNKSSGSIKGREFLD